MFYTALADGTFEITDSVVQGDRVCSDDTDRKYLNVLGMANEFVAISNTVTLNRNRIFLVTFRKWILKFSVNFDFYMFHFSIHFHKYK